MIRLVRLLGAALGFLALVANLNAVQNPNRAVPLDPVGAILDAFQSHRLVALGEGNHGNEQGHRFRLSLIRDARFATAVNDIVVECGNARYQDVMDRFLRGEDVPDGTLRDVWQNTTQPHAIWDVPIYEEFFRTVRAVNAKLTDTQKLRVLLGDPPIDWKAMNSLSDLEAWGPPNSAMSRDRYPAELIQREVLAKSRRALIIYGDMHFQRRDVMANFQDLPIDLLLARIERESGLRAFSVWTNTATDLRTIDPGVNTWPTPALIRLRGTLFGTADFTDYYPPDVPRFSADGSRVRRDEYVRFRMEDQFDAVLYLGPPASITQSRLSPARCADVEYMKMRLGRMSLLPSPPGQTSAGERLKRYCAPFTMK